jgi:uncharacterized protein DUF4160
MPSISRFLGITIRMFFNENFHPGRPHFHAEHSGVKASFEIKGAKLIAGALPPRIEHIVRQWAREHEDELIANWERARNHQQLEPIDPFR